MQAVSAAAATMIERRDVGTARAGEPGPTSTDVERADRLRTVAREHFPAVWRFLRRLGFDAHVVDDAAHDLFLVALRRIDDVAPGRERAFLFGAALKIAKKLKRKRTREVLV